MDQNLFISKLDSDGNFLWAVQTQNIGTARSYGTAISLDKDENIVVTGSFHEQVDFDSRTGPYIMNGPTSENSADIFITKFNKNGNFIWAKQLLGTIGSNYPYSLAIDAFGNIHISGEFRNTVDFDPGPGIFSLTSSDYRNGFVLKLDADGNFNWVGIILKGSDGPVSVISMDIDSDGNVYITGSFYGTVDIDPASGTHSITATGQSDLFVSKLNPGGNLIWVKTIGGNDRVVSSSIALDSKENIYISGAYIGTADFDPGNAIKSMTSSGAYFLTKLDKDGNFLWVKNMIDQSKIYGGTNTVFIDQADNVFLTGIFQNTSDFDPGPGNHNLSARNNFDYFITKLDPFGNFEYAGHIESLPGHLLWRQLPITFFNDFIYALGDIQGTGDVDPGSDSFLISSTGYSDLFVLKLRQYREFTLGEDTTTCEGDIFTIIPKSIYPNDKIL
ncbi:MAG: hypothetical protein WD077_14890, partial [Bacteroidia bacterium]